MQVTDLLGPVVHQMFAFFYVVVMLYYCFFYAFVKFALSEYMCAAHYKAFSHSEYTCTIYLINVGSKHNAIS